MLIAVFITEMVILHKYVYLLLLLLLIRQKEQTSTGIISHATNLHILK